MSKIKKILTLEIKPLHLYSGILIALLFLYAFLSYKKNIPPFTKETHRALNANYQAEQSTSTSVKVEFEKEYTYQAIEADSRISGRTMAFAKVKQLLLEESAMYLQGRPEMQKLGLRKDRIAVLAACVVQPEIIDERWTLESYYLKARLSFNPDDAIILLRSIVADHKKSGRIEKIRKRARQALKAAEGLRKHVVNAGGVSDMQSVRRYNDRIRTLISTDFQEQAYTLLISDKYDQAIETYTKAVESFTGDPTSYIHRGLAYRSHQDYKYAVKDFKSAVKLEPNNILTYSYMGDTHNKLGNYSKAIDTFNRALKLESNNIEPSPVYAKLYYDRGIAYAGTGYYQKSIEDYNRALTLGFKSAEIHNRRGISLYKLKRYKEAIDDFKMAIKLNSKFVKGYYFRGLTYKQLGSHQQAINDFDKVIELEPTLTDAYMMRGLSHLKLGNPGKAMPDFSMVIKSDPKSIDGYTNRGLAFLEFGSSRKALKDYNKALELDPKRAESYNSRGLYYLSVGKYENALMDFSIAIELDTGKAAFFSNRGDAFYSLRYYSKAIADFDMAISSSSSNAGLYNKRGNAYLYSGDADRAIEDFKRADELDLANPETYNYLGNAYSYLDNYDQAIHFFSMAIDLNHSRVEGVYYNRGRAYYNQGLFENAFDDFEEDQLNEYAGIHKLLAINKISMVGYKDYLQQFKQYVRSNRSREWIRTISKYYLGYNGMTEEKIISEANNGKNTREVTDRLCEAYYYLAEMRLIKGDRQVAEELFNKSIEKDDYHCIVYTSAKAMLKLMKNGVL